MLFRSDPVTANLVQDMDAPGGTITGVSDALNTEMIMKMMLAVDPDIQTVGLLYTSSEDNSILQIEEAKAILEEMNLDYVEQTVAGSNDVQQAVQSIVTRCDAIYIPTDNTFASAMSLVGSVVMESGTPVICGATGMVEAGGLITLGLNYYNLGYQTGEMAVQVLEGADPASMPVQSQNQYDYVVNEEMLSALGMELPQSLLEKMGDAA